MAVAVRFQWRVDPVRVGLTFSGRGIARVHVVAVIAPVLPVSWIHAELAAFLRHIDGVRAAASGREYVTAFSVQGTEIGSFAMIQRVAPLPFRLERGGTRAEIMLGLDFLALFRETRLTFDGETALLTRPVDEPTLRTPRKHAFVVRNGTLGQP